MTPSASRSPKRLPSSCPHGRSQIDVRKRDAAAARTPAAGLAPAPSAARQAPGPPLPPGLAGVYPPADDLRAAARHGAAGMLHGEAPAYRRRRPAPARPLRDPRPQAARRQAPRSTRNRLAAHGPAARGPGHVAAARPRTRPEPPGPARPVRFALAGREPRVASDLPAGRGRMPSRHHGHAAHARPVAHLNPDDLPSLFRPVRIHLAQGATPLRLAIRTISNLTGAALSIRQRAKEQKNVHLRGPVSVCLSGQKEKPRSYAGLFQRGHKRGRERPRLMVDEALGPRQVSTSSDAARWTVRTGASWPDQS